MSSPLSSLLSPVRSLARSLCWRAPSCSPRLLFALPSLALFDVVLAAGPCDVLSLPRRSFGALRERDRLALYRRSLDWLRVRHLGSSRRCSLAFPRPPCSSRLGVVAGEVDLCRPLSTRVPFDLLVERDRLRRRKCSAAFDCERARLSPRHGSWPPLRWSSLGIDVLYRSARARSSATCSWSALMPTMSFSSCPCSCRICWFSFSCSCA